MVTQHVFASSAKSTHPLERHLRVGILYFFWRYKQSVVGKAGTVKAASIVYQCFVTIFADAVHYLASGFLQIGRQIGQGAAAQCLKLRACVARSVYDLHQFSHLRYHLSGGSDIRIMYRLLMSEDGFWSGFVDSVIRAETIV